MKLVVPVYKRLFYEIGCPSLQMIALWNWLSQFTKDCFMKLVVPVYKRLFYKIGCPSLQKIVLWNWLSQFTKDYFRQLTPPCMNTYMSTPGNWLSQFTKDRFMKLVVPVYKRWYYEIGCPSLQKLVLWNWLSQFT